MTLLKSLTYFRKTAETKKTYVRQLEDSSISESSSHHVRFLKPFRKKEVTALSFSSSSWRKKSKHTFRKKIVREQ